MKKTIRVKTQELSDYTNSLIEDISTLNQKIITVYIATFLLNIAAIVIALIALFRS